MSDFILKPVELNNLASTARSVWARLQATDKRLAGCQPFQAWKRAVIIMGNILR